MAKVTHLLERMMGAGMLDAVKAAGAIAGEWPANEVYLVGGPVRDMLLGHQPADIDLCVVGDGKEAARRLAARLNATVEAHSEFGTARVTGAFGRMDVATARSETYAHPAALPRVEPAGIEPDLLRRDFSVNAMAVALWPAAFGELTDPCSGQADIVRRQLRTLHETSFHDDPTRILRGIRYEVRLDFKFEPRTLARMTRDLGYLSAVSGARIKAEIEKALGEPRRAAILRRAEEVGALAAIDPALRVNRRALEVMDGPGPDPRLMFDLALMCASISETEAAALVLRLSPPAEWREVILGSARYRSVARRLEEEALRPSAVAALLRPFPVPVLQAQLAVAPPTRQRERLADYVNRSRMERTLLNGEDLIREGIAQGPVLGAVLDELLAARIDAAVKTEDDEWRFVRGRIEEVRKVTGR
jgi:tRNA nucleotidyltransferase (CCA-adding enzyme)